MAALIAAALARVVPGRFGYWLDLGLIMFALLSLRLCGRIMVARLGGLTQLRRRPDRIHGPAARITTVISQVVGRFSRFPDGPRSPSERLAGVAAKLCSHRHQLAPNMLKKRVLLSSGEFHSGSKRATRGAREQRSAGGVRTAAVAGRSAIRGLDAGSNTQGDLVSAPEAGPA